MIATIKRLFESTTDLKWMGFLAPQLCASLFNDFLSGSGGMTFPPFILAETAMALVIMFAHIGKEKAVDLVPTWLPPALCCAGLVSCLAYGQLHAPELIICAAVLGGFGVSAGYAKWLHLYCGLGSDRAIGYILFIFVITGLLKFVLPFVPFVLQAAIAVFLTVVSAKWEKDIRGDERENLEPAARLQNSAGKGRAALPLATYLPLLVELMAFAGMLGYMSWFMPMWQTSAARFTLRLALSLVLFFMLFARQRTVDVAKLVQTSLAITMAAPFAASFFPAYTDLFITTGICLLQILVLVTLADLTRWDDRNPYATFGLGWGVFSCGLGSGRMINTAIGAGEFTIQIAFVMVCLLTVITVFALTKIQDARLYSSPDIICPAATSSNTKGRGNAVENRSLACAAVGEDHGLTKREIEIMEYIGKGRSKRYIAEELSVSENTVRMHTKKVYLKLGINSKQELISLIDERESTLFNSSH